MQVQQVPKAHTYSANMLRKVHISNQKSGRRVLTIIENLNPAYNFDKILRAMKNELCCSGVVQTSESGSSKTIQLQGNFWQEAMVWLLSVRLVKVKEQFQLHGIIQK